MADEKWQKVRDIFDAALRQPPEARPDYLRHACGEDQMLLAEVKSLLSSYDSSEDFLAKPAVAPVADIIEAETKRLFSGKVFGHYEIIEQIGAGGMGEVYLAKDTKLGRQVAVKILNEKYSQKETNLQRFRQEAKAASALNHPNILVIHEIGETDAANYIVSEYVEGRTLREVLAAAPLQLSEILDVAIQTANALSVAHAARIIHRDIKPENLMLRPDGLVKVLDFGLAKLVGPDTIPSDATTLKEQQTASGMILGTVNYMSPEQAKAEKVDSRTDIFSLGAMLYEMIAGRAPFAGNSMPETLANLMNSEAQPLTRYAANVPDELQRIVGKMLRKDRDERYQTMKDALTDLKDLKERLTLAEKSERYATPDAHATGVLRAPTGDVNLQTAETLNSISQQIKQHKPLAALALAVLLISATALGYYFFYAGKTVAGGKKSIAVLPLKPINTAIRDELYEAGIAETLIQRLNSMKGFQIRPLSATRKYTDLAQDPLAAGKEQQVDYVLAANYQLAGGKIRVTAQLFNVASGQIEETYTIDKNTGDILAAQDAIAGEVGNRLQARFAVTSSSPTAKRGTTNEEAYRLYLQGRNLTYNRTPAAAKKAVEYFEQAIKLDPNFALAYSGRAHAYIMSGNLGGGLPREEYEKARAAVNKALELDNNLAEGYEVLGELKFTYEWDFAGAEKDFLRAIELDPNSESAHEQYAFYLAVRKRFDEAIAESKTALDINPGSQVIQQRRGVILYFARRYDEAIIQLKRIIEVNANFVTAYGWLRATYEKQGDAAQAYDWFIKSQKQINSEHIELYQNIYKTSGWKAVKQKQFEMEKQNEQKPSANLYAMARLCAQLGEKEQAFEYLNKAFEKRQGQMVMLNVEPAFDPLRDDPRFAELVRRVGLK